MSLGTYHVCSFVLATNVPLAPSWSLVGVACLLGGLVRASDEVLSTPEGVSVPTFWSKFV